MGADSVAPQNFRSLVERVSELFVKWDDDFINLFGIQVYEELLEEQQQVLAVFRKERRPTIEDKYFPRDMNKLVNLVQWYTRLEMMTEEFLRVNRSYSSGANCITNFVTKRVHRVYAPTVYTYNGWYTNKV